MELEYIIRLLIAAGVGSIIGIEREYRDKSAGFRTMILIAVGAALFTIISYEIGTRAGSDPARIASSIVSGIGFLGAGVIIKDGAKIRGLTTASTIWLTAALGMGIGAGYTAITVAAACIIMFALLALPYIEHWIDGLSMFHRYEIVFSKKDETQEIISRCDNQNLYVFDWSRSKVDGQVVLAVSVKGNIKDHQKFTDTLVASKNISDFS